jgi:hypothetical protein
MFKLVSYTWFYFKQPPVTCTQVCFGPELVSACDTYKLCLMRASTRTKHVQYLDCLKKH